MIERRTKIKTETGTKIKTPTKTVTNRRMERKRNIERENSTERKRSMETERSTESETRAKIENRTIGKRVGTSISATRPLSWDPVDEAYGLGNVRSMFWRCPFCTSLAFSSEYGWLILPGSAYSEA